MGAIRRILYYTHNSIGIGHVFRARAVITGIRRSRPDVDFLVLSGTSIPHVLLREGIEVVKLPGVERLIAGHRAIAGDSGARGAIDGNAPQFRPRHLREMTLDGVVNLRRRIIAETCRAFRPDVLMVEHYLGGLLGEMTAVLRGNRRGSSSERFIAVALSRGIISGAGSPLAACAPQRPADLIRYFDCIYCFDDAAVLRDGDRPMESESFDKTRFACLGRITDKCRDELPDRSAVCKRFRLTERPIILLSLSRHGDVGGLCIRFLEALRETGLDAHHQVIFVIDPYLKPEVLETIQRHPLSAGVRFLPFFYPLVDIIHAAELVISRAGYNTINELLLAGARAVVIPEEHPGGEQEARVGTVPLDNIVVLREEEVLREPPAAVVRDILRRKQVPLRFDFDKYGIGERIMTDLEACAATRRGSS